MWNDSWILSCGTESGFLMKELDWKILIVLYEKRSITKTAEALFLTQSAVTKRLQNMENEWGIHVIRRSSQGVSFTEDGTYLAQRASVMLDFLREIREHYAQRDSRKETLTIGIPNSFSRLYFPDVLSSYIERFDRLDVHLIPNSSEVILQKLMDGSLDMGFVCGDYPYLGEKTPLMDENLYLLIPNGAALEDVEKLPLIQWKMNPLVEMIRDQWWKSQYGTLPHGSYSVPFADIAIEMVEKGLGVTTLFGNKWRIDPKKAQLIQAFDEAGNPVRRKIWMMISDRCFQNPDIADFISLVESFFQVNM